MRRNTSNNSKSPGRSSGGGVRKKSPPPELERSATLPNPDTPPDERDRVILSRSIRSAYYVLIVGMILVGCVMPFNSSGWSIINAALVMIVAAEVVHYGVAVFSYRRQA